MNRRLWVGAAMLVAVVAIAPFARGLLRGESFFFRDLSRQFLPLRLFVVEGLLAGEVRYWNPYSHEGEPLSLPPLSYPPDLLHVLAPDEAGVSLLLALHGPLAALLFLALARGLGLGRTAAVGGAIVYSLGGFALSCVNFYIYFQALAWSPLIVLGLYKAARGGGRLVAAAALPIALALSTTGVELVLQALLVAACLSLSARSWRPWLRVAAGGLLGVGLAAHTILYLAGLLAGSAREAGFPTSVVLAHSVHPMTFLQVVVASLYGDIANLTDSWWGQNFFPLGFPYILSLYLGAAVLSVAVVGARHGRPLGTRLAWLVAAAVVVCLGRHAHLEPLVEALPVLGRFRFPTKAYFTIHMAVALLTALGLDALSRQAGRRAWRLLGASGLAFGGLLAAASWLPRVLPEPTRRFAAGFFPPGYSASERLGLLQGILADARLGGSLALAAGLVGLLVLARRLAPARGAVAVGALIAVDLLRTGAGLNPTVTPGFYEVSAEMSPEVERLRQAGRVFTCEPDFSPAYHLARRTLTQGHEVWTFATNLETLSPHYNVPSQVRTAYSRDLTMLVPVERVLTPAESGCSSFGAIAGRLRRAGVAHVLSLGPLESPELRLRAVVEPARTAPLKLHIADLEHRLPLRAVARTVRPARGPEEATAFARTPGFQQAGGVAVEGSPLDVSRAEGSIVSLAESPGRLEMLVETDTATVVVVREAFAKGWTGQVDGAPAPVLRADGRHLALPVPAGSSRVGLRYRPPHLGWGFALGGLSALVTLVVWVRGGDPPAHHSEPSRCAYAEGEESPAGTERSFAPDTQDGAQAQDDRGADFRRTRLGAPRAH